MVNDLESQGGHGRCCYLQNVFDLFDVWSPHMGPAVPSVRRTCWPEGANLSHRTEGSKHNLPTHMLTYNFFLCSECFSTSFEKQKRLPHLPTAEDPWSPSSSNSSQHFVSADCMPGTVLSALNVYIYLILSNTHADRNEHYFHLAEAGAPGCEKQPELHAGGSLE